MSTARGERKHEHEARTAENGLLSTHPRYVFEDLDNPFIVERLQLTSFYLAAAMGLREEVRFDRVPYGM